MSATVYNPSPWGLEFHSLQTHEALGAGSAGPGKTEVLLHDADQQILVESERCDPKKKHEFRQPRGSSTGWALHLRRTSPMLQNTLQRAHRVFPIMDPGAKWREQTLTWEFTSGYRYQFGMCAEASDWERYFSAEYTWIGFDELVQFNEEQYDQIITRLRSTDPVLSKMLKVRSMSNPVMRRGMTENFAIHDPYWVRKRFVDPAPEGRKVLKRKLVRGDGTVAWRTRIYLPAKLRDNPNPEFVRQYEETLLSAPPHVRLALLEGNWYVTADSYFGAVWNEQQHVCAPFAIPPDWPVFRSMDWGYKTPGCIHWYAVSPEGQVFVFKELTFKDKTADVVAEMVKEIEKELKLWGKNDRSRVTGPADTQLWEARGEKGKSKAQEFLERGISWTKADKKSRQRNAERLSRLLDPDGGTRDPGIVFFRGCVNAIRTIPAIQMDPKNMNEPMDGGEDHWFDSICYGSAHVSRGASYVGSRFDDDDDDDKEAEAREERGRYGYGSAVA